MKSLQSFLLAVVCGLFGLGPARVLAEGEQVQVIEPQAGKLVSRAHISVRTPDGRLLYTTPNDTGLYGDGFDVERDRKLNPRWKTLVLHVEEQGIPGNMRIDYDPDAAFWAQDYDPATRTWVSGHGRGAWRPETVYRYDDRQKVFVPTPYPVYRAAVAAQEQLRLEGLESLFSLEEGRVLQSAINGRVITASEGSALNAAMTDLLRAGPKNPIAPPMAANLIAAFQTVLQNHLPNAHPAVVQAVRSVLEPGFKTRMAQAVRTAPDPIAARRIRDGLVRLANLTFAAAGRGDAGARARGLERVLDEVLGFLEATERAGGTVPMDAELAQHLQWAAMLVSRPIQARIDAVLRGPRSETLLRNLEIQFNTQFGRNWSSRIDDALRLAVPDGLQAIRGNPAQHAELSQVLQQLIEPLEQVFDSGLELPLNANEREFLATVVAQGNVGGAAPAGAAPEAGAPAPGAPPAPPAPPPLQGRFASVLTPAVNPVVLLLVDLGGRLEDLLITERNKAPVPPMIMIPMERAWSVPVVRTGPYWPAGRAFEIDPMLQCCPRPWHD